MNLNITTIASLISTAALVLLLVLGCASSPDAANSNNPADADTALQSLRGEWLLTHLEGNALDTPAPDAAPNRRPTLNVFDADRVGGASGVNRWSTRIDAAALSAGGFRLSPIATTLMAGPPDAMRLEQQFVNALSRVTSYDPAKLRDNTLSLLGADNNELLRFSRKP